MRLRRLLERWRFLPPALTERGPAPIDHLPPAPDPGPAVLELEPIYGNGATGALVRLELAELEEARVPVPAGAAAFRVRVVHRAGLYAGETIAVERESEPVPAFLGFRRHGGGA